MASYEEIIKGLEDQVALLRDVSSNRKRRFEDIEKQLEESNKKLKETEGALKETTTKLAIAEKKLKNATIAKIEGRISGLDSKVEDIARTCTEHSNTIAKLQDRILGLDNKPDDIETTCTEHSNTLRGMTVYHSSLCRDVDVDHAQGILTQVGFDVFGYFMSAKPLTIACPHFSVEVLDDECGCHVIGLAPTGWDGRVDIRGKGMVGYYGYDGRIMVSDKEVHRSEPAQHKQGDVMKIALTVSPPRIEIHKNNTLIHSQKLGPEFKDKSLHAVVQLERGSKVKLLETDPWRA